LHRQSFVPIAMTDFPNWFDVTARDNFEKYAPDTPRLKVLQIGVFTGDATEWLLSNRDIEYIVDVDTWQGSSVEFQHEKINFAEVEKHYDSRFKDNTKVDKYKMNSTEFLSNHMHDPEEYDFIYIDGDHTALQVGIDGLLAWRGLKPGGVIAFDDYAWQSDKGSFYEPITGIQGMYHIVKTEVDLLAENAQVWLRKK